jgi:alpha-ribazole phosphatase/probable phosphoglycerate mutase
MDFGNLEGLAYDDIAARYPDVYAQWMQAPAQVRFPNGESLSDLRARVLQAFHAIRQEREGETVALLSHGGVNRILLAWALEIPDGCLFRLAQDYAAMNLLTFSHDSATVELMNYHTRLTAAE